MKRKIALSTALVLTLIAVSLSTDSSALAQSQMRVVGDSGLITGSNQTLRIIVKWEGPDFDTLTLRFVQMDYAEGGCSGFVCKQFVSSQSTSSPVTLTAHQAARIEYPNLAAGIRVVVLSNRRNTQVNYSIVENTTGQVNATWIFSEAYP